jgi:DNA-binding NarL/FixJ family response regulator
MLQSLASISPTRVKSLVIGSWPKLSRAGLTELSQGALVRCPAERRALCEMLLRLDPGWLVLADAPEPSLRLLLTCARQIRPGIRVAVLGPPDDFERCQRWLRRGASVYLEQDSTAQRLARAIELAASLGVIVTDESFQRLARAREAELRSSLVIEPLTARESGILELVRAGLRNLEIARALGVKESTVEFHVGNLLKKLGAANRTEAVSRFNQLGL